MLASESRDRTLSLNSLNPKDPGASRVSRESRRLCKGWGPALGEEAGILSHLSEQLCTSQDQCTKPGAGLEEL